MKSKLFIIKAAVPIVSILLLMAGIIQLRGQFWVAGTVCLVLAMAGILYSMRTLESDPFTPEDLDLLRPWLLPGIAWGVILGLLALSVYYVADNVSTPATDRIAALAWVTSVILGLIVTWKWGATQPLAPGLKEKLKAHRKELGIALFLVMAAFAMRTVYLSTHPYPWSGDEASVGSEGLRILKGEITNFFDVGWSIQPNWSFLPTAIAEAIFGKNLIAIRLPSALAGTLAVLFLYLAARELFGPAVALLSAAFLATFPYQVHFSRVGVQNVVDSLVSSLVVWLIARGINTEDARYYYFAGAVAGLSVYTYAGTKLVLILSAVIFLFLVISQKGYLASHWKHILNFGLGALVSIAPQAAYFARHPNSLMGRFGQEGILFNGWLAHRIAASGKNALEILFDQLSRTVLVFVASPALGNFFNSPYPYLTVLGSLLFLVGMGYALAYLFKWRNFAVLVWFWAVILFGGVLTLNPPANTRLLMTSPVVALMMALGTYKLVEYLQKVRVLPQRAVVAILAAVVLVVSFQNIQFYMFEYKNKAYFQDANGEFALEVGLMAQKQGPDFQVFTLGAPRIFAGFPTLAYLTPTNPRFDVNGENLGTLQLDPTKAAGFFAIPENHGLLDDVMQKYPGGESGRVYRKTIPAETLFEYYLLTGP